LHGGTGDGWLLSRLLASIVGFNVGVLRGGVGWIGLDVRFHLALL
jgi:hypothetical protein